MIKKQTIALLAFLFLAIMPSIIYVVLSQSSISLGMLISVLICLVLFCNAISLNKRWLFLTVFIVLTLLATNTDAITSTPVKGIVSLFLLALYFIASSLIGNYIQAKSDGTLRIFIVISAMMLCFGIMSLFYRFSFLGYERYSKSIFTFYEPSHFALVISPFFIVSIFFLKLKYKFFYLASILLLAIIQPSLILMVVLLLALITNIKKIRAFLLYIILILVGGYIILATGGDFDYFISRLEISSTSSNLSALIYVQGWLDAYNALIETNFVGLGFQQAGTNFPTWINNRIYDLSGMYMNRNDGSFTASKIVSEFGVFGLLFVLWLTIIIAKAFLFLFKAQSDNEKDKVKIIASILLINYSIELYFRSAGYFTLGTLLMLTGVYLLYFKKSDYDKNDN